MKREELIKKLCEIAIHVGVGLSENTEPTIEGIVEELRLTNCGECKSLAGELESLSLASGEDDGYVYGITADLKQYITNLLYFAHEDNEEFNRIPSKFDEWVGEQVENIDGYFKSAPHPSPTAEKPMTAEIDIHKMINDYHIKLSESRDAIEYALTQIDFGKTIESLIANASLKPTVEVSDEDISKLLDSFNFEASEEREDAWDLLNAMRELIKERSKI